MNLFKNKNNTNIQDRETAEERKKKLENVLALQKRHPFLDRLLMLAGIAFIIIVAIPFIYISFELSVFNMIGGGFQEYMHGNETTSGLLDLFKAFGTNTVPILQISWDQASWLFCFLGSVIFFTIIIVLILLIIIYIRDFATIIKGIMIMLSKNTENISGLVKDQLADTKNIAENNTAAKKNKKKTKKLEAEPTPSASDTKPTAEAPRSNEPIDYNELSDDELDKMLGLKK